MPGPRAQPRETTAAVGVGSSLGDRRALMTAALRDLESAPGVRLLAAAAPRETVALTPAGPDPGAPAFLNTAVLLAVTIDAPSLLELLHAIERRHGRDRAREPRWGPRTLDLDLLLFGDAVIDLPGLRVPHPRMHERRFVLEPLAEIAPGMTHPALGRTVAELLSGLRA